MQILDFLIFGLIWHLEGFGSMENTPTGCGSDLHTSAEQIWGLGLWGLVVSGLSTIYDRYGVHEPFTWTACFH